MKTAKILYQVQPGDEKKLIKIPQLLHGDFYYCHEYLVNPKGWFDRLFAEIPFTQGNITVYGKTYPERRLTCMFSIDPENKYYGYSGKTNELLPMTPLLNFLRADLSRIVFDNKYDNDGNPIVFNTVLANYYRDGNDYISMHNDSEQSLVPGMPIASVSINCVRHFDLHCIENACMNNGLTPHEKFRIDLNSGSLLIMGRNSQKYYKHGVPVEKTVHTPRLNLTFRVAK
jgi:alkylated DNA repair dioxygenase AlkB